jgi:hypothetical protein
VGLDSSVIDAWKKLLETFDKMSPPSVDGRNLGHERLLRQAILLDAIAKSLKVNIPQLDIFHGGYAPDGWRFIEEDQNDLRQFLAKVARGQAAIPVMPMGQPPSSTDGGEIQRQSMVSDTGKPERDTSY